jgi:hypothetical protein
MPIKFLCPNPACKKPLNAKDHLAGKKIPCPACKQVLTIPAPVSKPADVEDLAANVFSDPPPAAPVAAPKFVEFNCPMCDEKLKLSADLAGKRAPCPECRRIIKVPELQKPEAKDWRQPAKKIPSGAKEAQPEKPEGAWDAGPQRVSATALEEAGALPVKREPLTARQWAFRIGTPVVLVTAVLLLGGFGWHYLSQRATDGAVEYALEAVTKKEANFNKEARAEVHRAAGEYYLRTGRWRCVEKAKDQFARARGFLAGGGSTDADLLLIDLAASQVELGSDNKDELSNQQRLSWGDTQKELGTTLDAIHNPEARARALREVTRRLVARGKPQIPYALLDSVGGRAGDDPTPEVCGLVGLDLSRDNAALAGQFADKGVAPYAQPGGKGPPPSPALIALCMKLRPTQADPFNKKWPDAVAPEPKDPLILAGRVAGLLIRKTPPKDPPELPPEARFQAQLLLAEEFAHQQQPDDAKTMVEEALQSLHGPPKVQATPWQLLRLAEVDLAAGAGDRARVVADLIPDPGLKGRVQLEALRAEVEASKGKAEKDAAEHVVPSLAQAQAWELVARTNGGSLTAVNAWPENVRPFGKVGAALGAQDAAK